MFEIDTRSSQTIEESFVRIAETLFNKFVLIVNNHRYRLLEIEFYYHHPNPNSEHADCYTHKHKEQQKVGTWYFHGSGLDITIGSEDAYGGILIRSLGEITVTGDIHPVNRIFGPLNVVTEIFSRFHDVTNTEPNSFRLQDLRTEPNPDLDPVQSNEIVRTTRIGLNPEKDRSSEKNFHNKLYRFLIFPHLPHRDKTGIAEALYTKHEHNPEYLKAINKIMGGEFLKKHYPK